MTTFSSRNVSTATIPVPRERIWTLVADPDTLADLTPLVDTISVDGDVWCWTLAGISALGIHIAPSFTEHMNLVPQERIDFRHAPNGTERAGANGSYVLDAIDGGTTRLHIDITLCADLPLPSFSRGAVERVMAATMQRTGDAFAANLYARLDVRPEQVAVEQLVG